MRLLLLLAWLTVLTRGGWVSDIWFTFEIASLDDKLSTRIADVQKNVEQLANRIRQLENPTAHDDTPVLKGNNTLDDRVSVCPWEYADSVDIDPLNDRIVLLNSGKVGNHLAYSIRTNTHEPCGQCELVDHTVPAGSNSSVPFPLCTKFTLQFFRVTNGTHRACGGHLNGVRRAEHLYDLNFVPGFA